MTRDQVILFFSQGFGSGRAPRAPGTFGSLVGLLWTVLLLLPESLPLFIGGCVGGILASAWLCSESEKILSQKDPGSVVIDEIIAIPICFLFLIIPSENSSADVGIKLFASHWPWVIGIFGAFRFFDIAKPWPVFQSQNLPGGWGVTADDVLAAGYVNLAGFAVQSLLLPN